MAEVVVAVVVVALVSPRAPFLFNGMRPVEVVVVVD